MNTDIFVQQKRRLKRKAIKDIAKIKQRLKSTKTNIKTAIETVLFYNSEIQLQFVRFRNNFSDINDRF